ncbi:MAG TPA: PEP/pyruvate-binding domain-containing protein [Rubrobacteraceae bacterium]|nr:PEP/pyruvate-binding domain-containing protein [Rubrobacteraceae bacterium]
MDVSQERTGNDADLVLPFGDLDRASLSLAGGKAANLGELIRAGLPVPPGFCVTTAAYELVAGGAGLDRTLDGLARTPAEDTKRLAELAAEAHDTLLAAPVPEHVAEAVAEAYRALGDGAPVAVRSSATAEDLPTASFAGQQDTYLNVVGEEPLIEAVRRCWASLWTDRAVSYRATNGIDPRSVHLAVAVQRMVEAEVAGVMFTADPVTGRRRRSVIDANPGLGEAVVSGAVNPDHFVVDTRSGDILERRPGDKRVAIRAQRGGGTRRVELEEGEEPSLTDAQIRALAELGARVEAHYGEPQDTEWAIDVGGKLWLLQARPITTLFPLPAGAPASDEHPRVYFSASVAQGVFRPLTPVGLQTFHLLASGIATLLGYPPHDRFAGPPPIVDAAGRLFVDVTPALRSTFGRRVLGLAMRNMEALSAPILERLAEDPRFAPVATPRWPLVRAVLRVLIRGRIPLGVARAFANPRAARERVARMEGEMRALGDVPRDAAAAQRLRAVERLLLYFPPRMFPNVPPVFATGLMSFTLAGKLLRGLATDDERRVVLRGLPHNPTTEMDLALWSLAQEVRGDPASAKAMRETPPERLAREYRRGNLPPKLQTELADFLLLYGHRGVAEIDLGLPRWSEDPTYILGVLANYLRHNDPELAPDVQFRRAERQAEEMVVDLTRRASRKGRLRGTLVGFLLNRARALAGLREMPKFLAILVFARARALLWGVGEDLARSGRLERAEDVFFITLPEARAALAGKDLSPVVRERRTDYEREVKRRRVPRILLSDGTEPSAEAKSDASADEGALRGTPASPGTVTAEARVILDPTDAHLEPGEILVAPSTDPGWTPLFLTAGGLVMEMGGPMSHGAIVAREYGIPAVVGVSDATERIATGGRITVDGSSGTIVIGQREGR